MSRDPFGGTSPGSRKLPEVFTPHGPSEFGLLRTDGVPQRPLSGRIRRVEKGLQSFNPLESTQKTHFATPISTVYFQASLFFLHSPRAYALRFSYLPRPPIQSPKETLAACPDSWGSHVLNLLEHYAVMPARSMLQRLSLSHRFTKRACAALPTISNHSNQHFLSLCSAR